MIATAPQKTPKTRIDQMADALRMAVIVKCLELNYIESGKYADLPPREVLAVMAQSIYDRVRIPTRDLRPWFIEVAKWKAEEGRVPLVALPDLEYAHSRWSDSYVHVTKGDPQLPAPTDAILSKLPLAIQLRDEKQKLLLSQDR